MKNSIIDSPEAGRVALKFFFGLMEKWGCSPSEQMVLLGSLSDTAYRGFAALPDARLDRDLLERISHLMGIHLALRTIFSNDLARAYQWVRKPNTAAPFNGLSGLEFMLSGGVSELGEVRRYLESKK